MVKSTVYIRTVGERDDPSDRSVFNAVRDDHARDAIHILAGVGNGGDIGRNDDMLVCEWAEHVVIVKQRRFANGLCADHVGIDFAERVEFYIEGVGV